MRKISLDGLASIEFELIYEHNGIRHTDVHFGQRVNLWRDFMPTQLVDALVGCQAGERIGLEFAPGDILPQRSESNIHQIVPQQIARNSGRAGEVALRPGRFYPKGILRGIRGVFPQNREPFRCSAVVDSHYTVDLNAPLAGQSVRLSAHVVDVREKFEEHGGTAIDWIDTVAEGAGMQMRINGRPTDFFSDHPFRRDDEDQDHLFYRQPRLVKHIDDQAIEMVSGLYDRLLRPDTDVLDLMSSWISHLPPNLSLKSVVGLGMNATELKANQRLTDYHLQDLNQNPDLPFGGGQFDAVLCAVSIEYLTHPDAVFAEVARVLKPGGIFITAFSNRWFPPKVIQLWPQLHEFERMGLVLEYFLRSHQFQDLCTYSVRGLPRPESDKYYPQLVLSDPVYAVWGIRS